MKQIFTEKLWEDYCSKVEENFKLKTYPHFDSYFSFPEKKNSLYSLISDPTLQRIASHNFIPFLKILQKTPRYRYQSEKEDFGLETKIRPISFASHFDTYIFGFYSFALGKKYEEFIKKRGFAETVLAYRSDLDGKCNIQFAKEAFDQIKLMYQKKGQCSVIALDIKGYFDHIDHKILKERWCEIIEEEDLPDDQYKIYKTLTKYSYINYSSFLKHFNLNLNKLKKQNIKFNSLLSLIPEDIAGRSFLSKMNLLRKRKLITINRNKDRSYSKIGIPQGSAMSALLSNVYLTDFDQKTYTKGQKEGFIYRRYCDDLLVICESDRVNELKDYIMDLIARECHLTIQNKKTDVVDFKISKSNKIRSYRRKFNETNLQFEEMPNENKFFKNLQYLGFEFNGQSIYIRPGSLSRYFRKMKARIVKSISMAYSNNSNSDVIFKSQIFKRYSHLGSRNFLSYANNASKKYYKNSASEKKEGMNSPEIKNQISRHMKILMNEIEKTSSQRALQKSAKRLKK